MARRLVRRLPQLGFWAFFLAIIGQASYRNHAGVFQLAVLFSSFSVTFILLTVPFGMIVDRWSPKWLMIVSGLISLASIMIAVFGTTLPWLDAAFAIDGVAAALIIPARGSLTALMVKERDLVRANGMLNTASMFAVIIGPGTAGLVERHSGHAVIYWYIFAAIGAGILLNLLVPDRRPRGQDESSFTADLTEGFRVSWRVPELRDLVFLSCGIWFLTTVLVTLEPLYVKGVLHRGVDGLGFLWSAHGVGSFLGAAALTRSRKAHGHEVFLLGVSLMVAGAGFLAYVGSSFFAVAVAGTVVPRLRLVSESLAGPDPARHRREPPGAGDRRGRDDPGVRRHVVLADHRRARRADHLGPAVPGRWGPCYLSRGSTGCGPAAGSSG